MGRKWFPGACWTAPEVAEKEEIWQVCKQDPLAAGEPPWQRGTGMIALLVPGSQPHSTWDNLLGSVICAGLQMDGGDDLLLRPDLEGEGALTAAKHGKGAVIGPLEWQNSTAVAHPDEGGVEEVSRQLVWQLAACLAAGSPHYVLSLLGREI